MFSKAVMCALLGALVACVDDDPEATIAAAIRTCPLLGCGVNGATAGDGLLLDEIDLFGRPNHAGVKLVGGRLTVTRSSAYVHIAGDQLWAYDYGAGAWLTGGQLVGNLVLAFQHTETGEPFEVRVAGFDNQSVTFREGPLEVIPVYALQARRFHQPKQWYSVCNRDTALAPDPGWTGLSHYAVVYRGDRYSRAKQVVANDPADGWAFIACASGAGAKLHQHRHTYAGGFNDAGHEVFPTTLAQRTTLLKAITADYCGDGSGEFTVTGTPLAYATVRRPTNFTSPHPAVRSIEALWGASGPLCLDQPRLVSREAVMEKCGRALPGCGLPNPPGTSWASRAWVLTGNP